MNTDVFCSLTDFPMNPKGICILAAYSGVQAGVADYGNRMGIPTANGTILLIKIPQ
jgi:phosphoribosylformylglycinamidine synthase